MASVFTYDPDPPRISSPWTNTPVSTPILTPRDDSDQYTIGGIVVSSPVLLEGSGISKLDPEPQDGPVEYKLHLLLRPRMHQLGSSLVGTDALSQQIRHSGAPFQADTTGQSGSKTSSPTPPPQARQKRLEHLTTQLLWRLQQSSPYHSQSTLRLVPPSLPESGTASAFPVFTAKLVSGLEESRGALYEIGVADDGTFVGLTKEEMDESLLNLRSMAASLGCRVEILKTVIVGDHRDNQNAMITRDTTQRLQKLWVVEALVLPNIHPLSHENVPSSPISAERIITSVATDTASTTLLADSQTEQLRVSLTGSTTSGKSSLIGTLSTSALDSGRGKTRLSLLKHRHEIESGVTSSVAPELIGYHTAAAGAVHVVNYGFGNTSSWNDIHNAAEGERLVFLLDSAGHPRYRRTAVRGLVSWAPHWTLCCIAADETEDFPSRTTNPTEDGLDGGPGDPSNAYLELVLKLDLRVIVAITKFDLATNVVLRSTLSRVLSTIKAVGRTPVLLKPDANPRTSEELQMLSAADIVEVESIFSGNNSASIVPIVLTSVVRGSGIRKLHALLRCIPVLPDASQSPPAPQDAVFQIDEVFTKHNATGETNVTNILSGHLCHGDVEIGDCVLLGPCTTELSELQPPELSRARSYPSRFTEDALINVSRSAPKADPSPSLATMLSARRSTSTALDTSEHFSFTDPPTQDEWVSAKISSIRNLRLPMRKLLAGQVGTIGIEFLMQGRNPSTHKIRKGMVLIKQSPHSAAPRACSGFKAILSSSAYHLMEPGALYTIYIASIRASARIVSVEVPSLGTNTTTDPASDSTTHNDDSIFLFDDPDSTQPAVTYSASGRREVRSQPPLNAEIEVSFAFVIGREWVQVGNKVLVMLNAITEGSSGLDGVVGVISSLT